MLKPSARAIASVSASNVQPFSPVRAVRGLGRGGAPELEAAEEVAGRLAQHRPAEQHEAPAGDPAAHRLAPPDGAPGASREPTTTS